ncbi:MAG: hypothetical protein D3909_00215 [Candidatus Electrothrix sp. ATG1]|nr:hypothetical protein [Candidatus Electrothrix sp. ATG1]MCI5208994.1 hypothetical protein [Candidatus Electrothrix sp. ATG2]
MLKTLGRFPWIFTPIIYLIAVHRVNASLEGPSGYTFIGLVVVVLLVEFVKSGDIGVVSFLLDTTFSVIAVIVSTALLTYMAFTLNQPPTFFHWLGYAIIIGDALLSPANAFRTALRNFGVAGQ